MAMVGALFKALAASQVDGEVNKLTFRLWSMFNRVEVETQGNGNIGNKPGFFACFVSKKQ